MSKPSAGAVRNLKAFVGSYLASQSGQAALSRKPFRQRQPDGSYKEIWRSSDMAVAFERSIA